jgi:DNA-directed RNA polymerase specialized sigma24 family protein
VRREKTGRPDADSHANLWLLEQVDRSQPTPEDRVAVGEEIDRLLHVLPEELRQIIVWKLEGFTNSEISCMIDKTVRTVELKLQLIRKLLEKECFFSSPDEN